MLTYERILLCVANATIKQVKDDWRYSKAYALFTQEYKDEELIQDSHGGGPRYYMQWDNKKDSGIKTACLCPPVRATFHITSLSDLRNLSKFPVDYKYSRICIHLHYEITVAFHASFEVKVIPELIRNLKGFPKITVLTIKELMTPSEEFFSPQLFELLHDQLVYLESLQILDSTIHQSWIEYIPRFQHLRFLQIEKCLQCDINVAFPASMETIVLTGSKLAIKMLPFSLKALKIHANFLKLEICILPQSLQALEIWTETMLLNGIIKVPPTVTTLEIRMHYGYLTRDGKETQCFKFRQNSSLKRAVLHSFSSYIPGGGTPIEKVYG